MTVHHIVTETDLTRVCPYCGRSTDSGKWESVFDHTNRHYKMHECECGKKISVKVDFIGTGHDSWNMNLDERIKEVDSQSQKR